MAEVTEETPKFLQGSLMRHVSVMSFTASIGLMSIFAVDFVDMIFIAKLGNAALAAAVGYAGALLFFTTSISIGFSIAAGALVARALGARKTEQAREFATTVLFFGLVVSVLVVVLVYALMPALLDFLGAEGDTKTMAMKFLSIIIPTMPVMMGAMIASAILRAHGDARRAMLATLAAGVVNAIIDPVLIFGFNLGLEGAAIASVISRLTLLTMALLPAIRVYNGFAPLSVRLLKRDFQQMGAIAAPAVLANVATPVGAAIVTREMARFGTDAVAGMAVIGRLTPVAFAVVFALSGAVGPIIGQNFGAGLHVRVRGAFVAALQFMCVYVLVVALLLFLMRGVIASAFDASGDTLMLIMLFCGPLALAWFFNGVIFVGNAAFNNLGHPIYSTWINWGRSTLGTWPFVMIGGAYFGAAGILIGQAAGGIFFAGIAVWLGLKVMSEHKVDVVAEPFQEHVRLHTMQCRRH
ncbi:MAG: MATE family efflux transporter [Granulosicoccus sp.]